VSFGAKLFPSRRGGRNPRPDNGATALYKSAGAKSFPSRRGGRNPHADNGATSLNKSAGAKSFPSRRGGRNPRADHGATALYKSAGAKSFPSRRGGRNPRADHGATALYKPAGAKSFPRKRESTRRPWRYRSVQARPVPYGTGPAREINFPQMTAVPAIVSECGAYSFGLAEARLELEARTARSAPAQTPVVSTN